jgi:hypothetical protein
VYIIAEYNLTHKREEKRREEKKGGENEWT